MKTSKFILALATATTLSLSMVANNNATQNEQTPDPIEEMKAAQERAKKEFEEFKNKTQDDYNAYKDDVIARYIAYRDSVLSEFVKHMKKPWTTTEVKPAVPKPIDRSVGPEIVPLEEKAKPQQDAIVDNTPVVTPKEDVKPTVKEGPKVQPKEEPKPTVKEEPKEEPRKEPKRSTKENTAPTVNEEPKVQPKEEVKRTVKEEPKAQPKEEPKAKPKKEEKKAVVKEEKKVVVENTPSVTPSTPKPTIIPIPTPVIDNEEPKEDKKPVVKEEPKPVAEEPKAEPKQETKPKKEGPKATPLNSTINELKVKDIIDLSEITFNVQPMPFVPVVVPTDNEPEYLDFEFFGTPISVRIDDRCRFTLSGVNSKAIASAMEEITKNELLNVTLGDCLDVRDDMKLCDWAYLEMLATLSATLFGEECNEATLLTGYLYCMSGYRMRFGINNKKVEILFASDQNITDLPGFNLNTDGYRKYYCFNAEFNNQSIQLCDYAFPNEKSMSLIISELPDFNNSIEEKNVKLSSYTMNLDHAFNLNFSLNKNLIDFYDTYPTPATEGDIYSRWIYYAKTPLSDTAKEKLYPTLKQEIEGKTELKAVNIILNWIHSYKYEYDEKVWGFDRSFFPDETLFYPYCDCEDRAILFSRIVSDLLGLKVALIYYPGHLAAAVKFSGDVQGDYIMHNGEKFTVCDATILGGRDHAGRTMESVKNSPATLILL